MKTIKLTFILVLVTAIGALAQDYAFKVLANKGGNEVKNGSSWEPLKTGLALKPDDEIRVAGNAYLGLVHNTGKPLELKDPGTYKVSDLPKRLAGGSSVVTKYTDFILSREAETKKSRLGATGAVDRGTDSQIELNLPPPPSQHSAIFNKEAIVSWEGTKVPGPYILVIKNMFDEEIKKIETPETSLKIDLSDPNLTRENALLVAVSSKTDAKEVSKQHYIKKLNQAEYDNIKKSLDQLLTEVSEPTALNKFILAGFYEENKLLIDAITAYQEAMKLAPDVSYYKEAYEDFLLRHNIAQ